MADITTKDVMHILTLNDQELDVLGGLLRSLPEPRFEYDSVESELAELSMAVLIETGPDISTLEQDTIDSLSIKWAD